MDVVLPGLVGASAATAGAVLGEFTDAFVKKLGDTLGEKSGDLLAEQVTKLLERIEGPPRIATAQQTQQVCDNLRTALTVEYLRMLAESSLSGSQVTTTAGAAAARVADGTDCSQLAKLIASIRSTVTEVQISTTIQIAITSSFIQVLAPVPIRPTPQVTYIVRRGDSLWSIASRQLPAAATMQVIAQRWMYIWSLNPATIPNPDLIYPGQILFIGS